jgi:Thioredoxin
LLTSRSHKTELARATQTFYHHCYQVNATWPLFVVALLHQASAVGVTAPDRFVESGRTWEQFLAGVSAQREVWLKTESAVTVPLDFIERAKKVSRGLQLLVVAEDWCPDSAYSVPYVARLAQAAGIPLRVIDRTAGEPLMLAHRTSDGRTATPTIVVLRNGRDVGAWVERPAELQQLFLSMSTNPENAQRFSLRHLWYESDGGLTVLKEVLALIEQTSEKK